MATFAKHIEKAAQEFPGQHSTAWVQYFIAADRTVKVRMQAPEIMKEFEGDVKFGHDPKGILFFKSMKALDIKAIRVRNAKYRVGQTSNYIVETEFGGRADPFVPFARFVAEVDTTIYTLPDFTGQVGNGTMRAFDAVTSHANVVRFDGEDTIYLESGSIEKQAHFKCDSREEFSQSGVVFFRAISHLKDKPNGKDKCMADYNSDRIVFYPDGLPGSVVALFLPNEPITNIGTATRATTWINTEPPSNFKAMMAEPQHDDNTSA